MSKSAISIVSILLLATVVAQGQARGVASPVQDGANSTVTGPAQTAALARPSLPLLPLKAVRSIYIEPMPNGLDWYITQEITKQLAGRVIATKTKGTADAVLVGANQMGLHNTSVGNVQLIGSDGATVLWSCEAGDKSAWSAGMKHGGSQKVASRLVHHLKKAMD